MEITAQRLAELEKAERKLNALVAGGVDNWEWYREVLKELALEEEIDEMYDKFIDDLNDMLTEAKVEEPAGRGCGYSIEFDEGQVKRYLTQLVWDIEKVKEENN